MKSIFVILFVSVCSIAFGKNEVLKNEYLKSEDVVIIDLLKNEANIKAIKKQVAFKYYYTMDWLYSETPFSHRLDAYV